LKDNAISIESAIRDPRSTIHNPQSKRRRNFLSPDTTPLRRPHETDAARTSFSSTIEMARALPLYPAWSRKT
jgi:hypothetical protein